jgi:hypothetical protein
LKWHLLPEKVREIAEQFNHASSTKRFPCHRSNEKPKDLQGALAAQLQQKTA